MIYTNKPNLPKFFFDALVWLFEKHDHPHGDYSTTGLQKSPRQHHLFKRHEKDIVVDIGSLIWLLFGIAGHELIKRFKSKNHLQEEYLEVDILGKKMSGISDVYEENGDILDAKFTSAYTVSNMSSLREWEAQLNIYAYLFAAHNFPVRDLYIVAMIRDWQRSRVYGNYPKEATVTIPIARWSKEDTELYIYDRVTTLEKHNDTPDDELPECTREERWQKDDSFAVMKEGAKRATKLFDDLASAEEHVKTLGPKFTVQPRIGEWTKCKHYCHAAQFCNQYKKYQAQFAQEQDDE